MFVLEYIILCAPQMWIGKTKMSRCATTADHHSTNIMLHAVCVATSACTQIRGARVDLLQGKPIVTPVDTAAEAHQT